MLTSGSDYIARHTILKDCMKFSLMTLNKIDIIQINKYIYIYILYG